MAPFLAFLGLLVLLALVLSVCLLQKHEWGKAFFRHFLHLQRRDRPSHSDPADRQPQKAPRFCQSCGSRSSPDAAEPPLLFSSVHAKALLALRRRKQILSFEADLTGRLAQEGGGGGLMANDIKSNVADKLVAATPLGSPLRNRNMDSTAEVIVNIIPNLHHTESESHEKLGPDFSFFYPISAATKDALKTCPLKRLVLEILISPANKEEGLGSVWSVSAVRLNLQTDCCLEHLENSKQASEVVCKMQDRQQHEKKPLEKDRVKCLSLPVDLIPITQEIASKLELQNSSENRKAEGCECSFSNTNVTSSLLKYGVSVVKLPSVEASAGGSKSLLDDVGNSRCFLLKVRESSTKPFGKRRLAALEGTDSTVLKFLTHASEVGDDLVDFGLVSSPCGCAFVESISGLRFDVINKEQHAAACKNCHNPSSFTMLDGLGSVGATFIEESTDSQVSNDSIKEAYSAQATSGLTSLVISSACKQGAEIGARSLASIQRDGLSNCHDVGITHSDFTAYHSHNSALKLERHEYEHDMDLMDEHTASTASRNDGIEDIQIDQMKKEKKRKKNRGRRQKGKGLASAVEVKEQHELGKITLEAANSASAPSRTDFGCHCGMDKGELHNSNCPYPFTSSGSMLQRKIKEQYDELVQSNAAKTLTLAQVGRFTTCLVESKAALQQKSEMIQRRFTIARSLLIRADISSFDRICGQIYSLEIEQKKLEEDTMVYNRLQEQLKSSPAYQKMLEYGREHFELQPRTGQMIEKLDSEDTDISFEELLAQEKKDAFWKTHSLPKTSQVHR